MSQNYNIGLYILDSENFNSHNPYRFGFNGKENDNDVKGEGSQQDYGMRVYDTRLCKFLTIDPLRKSYPELTPYQFASNTPIWAIDLDGMEAYFITDGKFDRWGEKKGKDAPVIIIQNAGDVKGVTLKNNLIDYKGKDITVEKFLKRAQRVYGVSSGNSSLSNHYAYAQDNVRKKWVGREDDNYKWMNNTDFQISSTAQYGLWNTYRVFDYQNIKGLNDLTNAGNALTAIINLLTNKTEDPTKGASAWNGGILNYETAIKYYESGQSLPEGVLDASSEGFYVTNLTSIITYADNGKKYYHIFYYLTKQKPMKRNSSLPKDVKNRY